METINMFIDQKTNRRYGVLPEGEVCSVCGYRPDVVCMIEVNWKPISPKKNSCTVVNSLMRVLCRTCTNHKWDFSEIIERFYIILVDEKPAGTNIYLPKPPILTTGKELSVFDVDLINLKYGGQTVDNTKYAGRDQYRQMLEYSDDGKKLVENIKTEQEWLEYDEKEGKEKVLADEELDDFFQERGAK
jgi:hypothetical protein